MAAAELKTLGRYNIEKVLGKGAMGVVYEGVDPRLGRRVAIKTILKSNLDEDTGKDFAMRFVREAQAVARLNHPNVVQVFDFGEEGDIAYIVMEFIRGKELKNFFDANERFDLKEAVRIMGELCDALDFAHNAGIVHRDIKPANVMIDSQGRTKLTDFGVARVQDSDKTSVEKTQAGTMVGTPAYMSPEQITGGTVDRRTDIFSAGIILYQFLTGEKPFTGSGAWTIAKKIIQEDPPAPSTLNNAITPIFDAVVNKALAKNVDERFQTAKDLGIALKRALEGKGVEEESDKTIVGGIDIDLNATMRGPAPSMPSPSAAAAKPGQTQATTQAGSQEVELEFWRAIKDGNDPDDFELYIQQFPNGIYAALAKRKISKLKGTAAPEDEVKAREQEKKEAADAAKREAEARTKLAEEKEKLELELAQKEEEYKRREAEREAQRAAEEQARLEAIEKAKQEAAAEREKARQEAEAERQRAREEAAAERERAKQEAAAQLAAEREKAKQEAEKARLEAEQAKKEAEAKAREEAEKARKEAAAERERARLEAEQVKKEAEVRAEKARKEAEEKAKKEAEALAKKQAEERAKREAEFKKREAELKAQAAAGGKKASPVVAIIVGVVVLAIAGTGYYFMPKEDPEAAAKLEAMQKQLAEAQQAQEQAKNALEKAKAAEEEARKAGDMAKLKQLEEERKRREEDAKKTADAAKAREADAKKGEEAAKLAKAREEKDKGKADQARLEKEKAERLAAEKAAAQKAEQERAAKAATDKAVADAKAAADKAIAEARAATEKAQADAAKAKAEAEAAAARAKQQVASAAPAASGGAADMFNQAQALEGQGKGSEAVRLYVKAARSGSGPAAKRLGEIYDKGIDGVSRDYAESLKWRNAARVLGEDVPTAKSRN